MKKMIVLILCLCVSGSYASKLSKFLQKLEEKNQRNIAVQEIQQDLDFNNFDFRLSQRYVDDHGQNCRDYDFNGRNNPGKHGHFTVCDANNYHRHP